MNCTSLITPRRFAFMVVVCFAFASFSLSASAQKNGRGNGKAKGNSKGPTGFHKSMPARPPATQRRNQSNRQPSQSFAERNHARHLHSNQYQRNYSSAHHYPNYRRSNYGSHLGLHNGIHYGYRNQNFGVHLSLPFSSGYYSTPYNTYSNYPSYGYDPYANSYYGSRWYSQTNLLPYDNFETRLNQYNASRLQQLVDQQSAMRPSLPIDAANLPRGLSVANKTSIPTDELSKADQLLSEAAFRERRYGESLDANNRAVARNQSNGYLWLFHSQVQLSLANYEEAVQDIGLATQMLDQKEWHFVIKNFREFYRNEDYVTQIDQLSQHIKTNPKDAVAVGLRGYHFGGLGYPKEAIADFEKAIELSPNEPIYRRLLAQFKKPAEPKPVEILPPPAPAPKPGGAAPSNNVDPPLTLSGPG